MSVDASYWTIMPKFGVAGGPLVHVLTDAGLARAFSVGAQVRLGPALKALEALYTAGGEGRLIEWRGRSAKPTNLGEFNQEAWGRLRDLGYVESVGPDGVRLTTTGHRAVENGIAEQKRLLDRVRREHPIRENR